MADPYAELKVHNPASAAEILLTVQKAGTLLMSAVADETTKVSKQTRSSLALAVGYAPSNGLTLLPRALVAQHRQLDARFFGEFKARLKQAGATNQVSWGVPNA
jgi:hypothetical protein